MSNCPTCGTPFEFDDENIMIVCCDPSGEFPEGLEDYNE